MSTRDLLRGAGLRCTRTRAAVLDLLADHEGPLAHDHLVARLSASLDRVTVYRTVKTLVEHDLVTVTGHDGTHATYALQSAHDDGHAHFVCTQCGMTACLPALQLTGDLPHPWRASIAAAALQLSGACPPCQAAR